MRRNKVDRTGVLKNSDLIEEVHPDMMEIDNLEAVKVDYKEMTKEELLTVLDARDTVLKNYEIELKKANERYDKDMEEMRKYYSDRISEIKAINSYHENKLKVIRDIIVMEGDRL